MDRSNLKKALNQPHVSNQFDPLVYEGIECYELEDFIKGESRNIYQGYATMSATMRKLDKNRDVIRMNDRFYLVKWMSTPYGLSWYQRMKAGFELVQVDPKYNEGKSFLLSIFHQRNHGDHKTEKIIPLMWLNEKQADWLSLFNAYCHEAHQGPFHAVIFSIRDIIEYFSADAEAVELLKEINRKIDNGMFYQAVHGTKSIFVTQDVSQIPKTKPVEPVGSDLSNSYSFWTYELCLEISMHPKLTTIEEWEELWQSPDFVAKSCWEHMLELAPNGDYRAVPKDYSDPSFIRNPRQRFKNTPDWKKVRQDLLKQGFYVDRFERVLHL